MQPSSPPQVDGRRLLRTLPLALHDRPGFLEELHHRHGDIFQVNLGFANIVMLHLPRMAQCVLRDNYKHFDREGPFWQWLREFLGNSLPVSQGNLWLRQRRLIQPSLTHKNVRSFHATMAHAAERSLDWPEIGSSWQETNIGDKASQMIMSILMNTAFGMGLSASQTDKIASNINYIIKHVFLGMTTNFLPRWIPRPYHQEFLSSVREIQETLRDIIESRRSSGEANGDILSRLIRAVDAETHARMSDAQLQDEAIGLLMAGHESTTSALTWALYLLGQHPEALDRARTEVIETIGRDVPDAEALDKLPYTSWVGREALRMFPPIWWIPRQSTERQTIEGYDIPPGTVVAPIVYTMHRNPAVWPNPERFEPERFSPERIANQHPFAWLPFGMGPHRCVGEHFALREAHLSLVMFLQRYEIKPRGTSPIHPKLSMSMRPPRYVPLLVRRRFGPTAYSAVN